MSLKEAYIIYYKKKGDAAVSAGRSGQRGRWEADC
jgi:hypothetical protein